MKTIDSGLSLILAGLIATGSLGWTFFKKSIQKALPWFSKWLCKKFFPVNKDGLVITWRTPRITMDRKTTNPQIDFYATIQNFTGYNLKLESIYFWVGNPIAREKHNIDIQSKGFVEIHLQTSLTDGEYRAMKQQIRYRRNEYSGISETNIGIRISARSEIGTKFEKQNTRDISFVLIEEFN